MVCDKGSKALSVAHVPTGTRCDRTTVGVAMDVIVQSSLTVYPEIRRICMSERSCGQKR